MQRLQTIAEGISRVGSVVGGAMLLIAAIVICIDIAMRYTLVLDDRRRRRIVRICSRDRQRVGLLGGVADALAYPHRHASMCGWNRASGPRSIS